jgi:hypothetical protein
MNWGCIPIKSLMKNIFCKWFITMRKRVNVVLLLSYETKRSFSLRK